MNTPLYVTDQKTGERIKIEIVGICNEATVCVGNYTLSLEEMLEIGLFVMRKGDLSDTETCLRRRFRQKISELQEGEGVTTGGTRFV